MKDYVYNDPSFPEELVQDVQEETMFEEMDMNVSRTKLYKSSGQVLCILLYP